jgi:hypothetical protein
MELDQIYEHFVLENSDQSDELISDIKISFDLLRSKLNRLALDYNQSNRKEMVNLIDNINHRVGNSLEQYEHMIIKYFPNRHKGLK